MANYSVNFWGSDPNEGNDDCWTGRDFDTRPEAEACYSATVESLGLKGCPSREVAYVELDGPDTHLERQNPGFRPSRDDNSDWKREQAMQAGMAFGCDGYNDEMGY